MNQETLVNRLKEHFENEDTTNFSVHDFVYAFGSPLLALAYAEMFWPEFVEFEGMVFLGDDFDEEMETRIKEMLAQNEAKNISQVEEAFNLFEIPSYFFGPKIGDTDEEEDEYLAKIIAQMWKCKLVADFPEKAFVVETIPPEESGGEVAVIFYQDDQIK